MDLKEEEILGDQVNSHWYYRAKVQALISNLRGSRPKHVLDIGAGSGYFSRRLLEIPGVERVTCVDIGYAEDRDEVHNGKPIIFRRTIKSSDADLVLAMDVIEHVPDDRALIRFYRSLAPSGARFIFSVPAFNFLWSGHDVFLEHYRRYTLRSLRAAMVDSELIVDWAHYYYATVFPLAATLRLMERIKGVDKTEPKSQLQRHGKFADLTLSTVLSIEQPFMKLNKCFGLTVFAGGHSA